MGKHRIHIKIKVLLTPGKTTPIDIRKPDNIKKAIEKLSTVPEKFNLFSKYTKNTPIENENKANNKYLNLKGYSELTFFTSIGMLPKISPIKQKLVCVGKLSNKACRMFPKRSTPIIPPKTIGNKNKKFFLKFLNRPNIEFISLSYMPNITQSTPLLIPGRIAPAPSNMPIKKFWIFFKRITIKLYVRKNLL